MHMLSPFWFKLLISAYWRDSKAVMQRPAKPFSPVRLRVAPPKYLSFVVSKSIQSQAYINRNTINGFLQFWYMYLRTIA